MLSKDSSVLPIEDQFRPTTMALWSVVFLAAFAAVLAEPIFPEVARERAIGSRIVSGWESSEGQHPWQLSLRMVSPIGNVNACGGSIIHSEWGLTAAHCTGTRPTIVIRAGAVNLTRPAYIFESTVYYNHYDYDATRPSVVQPNDIAILKFERAITFSDRVQPIRIQSSVDAFKDYSGHQLIASGWGRTWTNGGSPENMNWVYLRGVSNAICRIEYNFSPIIQDTTICAAYYNVTSQSTCQGDSGGPLSVVDSDGKRTLIGVTSFVSSQGCHTTHPAGFIRPGPYHEWIKNVTGIDFDWNSEEESSEESSEETSEESSEESSEEESTEEETEGTTGTSPTPEGTGTTDGYSNSSPAGTTQESKETGTTDGYSNSSPRTTQESKETGTTDAYSESTNSGTTQESNEEGEEEEVTAPPEGPIIPENLGEVESLRAAFKQFLNKFM